MSDSYQAIYDAVRSKISSGNIGEAVEAAIRDANLAFYADLARNSIAEAAGEHQRPSAVYRPSLAPDGTKWCALYGDNLAVGVAGFGDTPEEAMRDFDRAWLKERTPTAKRLSASQPA